MRIALFAIATLPLAGCVVTQTENATQEPGERALGEDGTCNADAAQSLVGQPVSEQLGTRALALTGAKVFRWAPPDSMQTMDYRQDRVTVHYDRGMRVTRIACG